MELNIKVEQGARNKLAEIFEEKGAEITGWLLRKGYFPELAFMVAKHELGRHKLTTPIKLYEEKFSDKRFGLILGTAALDGFINFNPEVTKVLFEYYREEHRKAKSSLQADRIEKMDIFSRICKYRKEGNTHKLLRCLWDALKEEDTEAIAMAARAAEALGVPRGLTKIMIRLFVKEWTEQKNYKVLILATDDLFEYVKEYLNPAFVKSTGRA